MAMVSVSASVSSSLYSAANPHVATRSLRPSSSTWFPTTSPISFSRMPIVYCSKTITTEPSLHSSSNSAAWKNKDPCDEEIVLLEGQDDAEMESISDNSNETLLYSFAPLPLLFFAALPGAGVIKSVFGPFAELVKSWSLPDLLVHWGHPGNMAIVLFAMGGYGTYLGFRIRYSDDVEEKANAKDLHPKLLGGMFFFFALGATGGITSLLTSDKPILESPHAVTAFIGLALLTIQTILPSLFKGNPGLRNVHGILGSGIMALFLIHAALGLQLGLSF